VFAKLGIFKDFATTIIESNRGVVDSFKSQLEGTGESFKGLFTLPTTGEITTQFDEIIKAIQEKTPEVAQASSEAFKATSTGAKQAINAIKVDFAQPLMALISTTTQTMGAQLIQGSKAWSNFSATILGIMGDFAIQLGGLLVLHGLAIDKLKESLLTLNGAGAVGAGLALIALGGALKAMAGGQSRQSSRGGRGGAETGGFVANTATPTGGQPDQFQQRQVGSSVQLVVQGDILDSQETGTRLAKILSDSFGKEGIVLTDVRTA
jgi:hypothetical protein